MIPLPLIPKITEQKDNQATFEIEALYPGYGTTIGNSLRRVLLSSLLGAAVTEVKIKGVQHEFSTIPGVLEDMVSVLMNLKQLRFKIHGDEPQKAQLLIKGEKEIKGSDFKLPSQIELINKDAHILAITDKKTEIDMEIVVEKGIGYELVERRKKDKLKVGVIALDAIFTPVRKISYKVENMRVGDRIDFDRLILTIETDGTITPTEAFVQASETLKANYSLFADTFKKIKTEKKTEKKAKEKKETSKDGLEDLKLSGRTLNALVNGGIKTAEAIAEKEEKEILELEGMGKKGVEEIKKALKKIGLSLK
ncbi:DNA-directed RNA polymerase subunit alpha [Candidatus Parcubacteria bacterium]|nr:DNA-directed RNA polymerase subunit alpha [Candidatus Parcubacteria bacterium]